MNLYKQLPTQTHMCLLARDVAWQWPLRLALRVLCLVKVWPSFTWPPRNGHIKFKPNWHVYKQVLTFELKPIRSEFQIKPMARRLYVIFILLLSMRIRVHLRWKVKANDSYQLLLGHVMTQKCFVLLKKKMQIQIQIRRRMPTNYFRWISRESYLHSMLVYVCWKACKAIRYK